MGWTVTGALVAAGVLAAMPLRAETVDLGGMTCSEVEALDAETVASILIWMNGYTGGLMQDSTFDAERMQADVTRATAECAQNPDRSLLDAMRAALE